MPETSTGAHVLDDVVRHSLTGAHAALAEGAAPAWRYRSDVSVFAAIEDDSDRSWAALAELTDGHPAVLFRARAIEPPAGWTISFQGQGHQLVLDEPAPEVPPPPSVDPATGAEVSVRELGDADVPAMVALVFLTQPGPFRPRTIEFGGYLGVFHDDRLVAMAGQRFRPPGYTEVSAVATHPDARRRRYASFLTAEVAQRIQARGDTAFLHVATDNVTAIPVYLGLGFAERTLATFAVVHPPNG
jgi:predicted GNAT family acetyltransferase